MGAWSVASTLAWARFFSITLAVKLSSAGAAFARSTALADTSAVSVSSGAAPAMLSLATAAGASPVMLDAAVATADGSAGIELRVENTAAKGLAGATVTEPGHQKIIEHPAVC